jgi:hypothetical protein
MGLMRLMDTNLMPVATSALLVAMFYFLRWLGVDFLLILDGIFSVAFCVVSVAGCWTSLSFARHRGRAGGLAEDRGRCQRWLVRRMERFLTSRTTEPEIAPAAPRPDLPLGADYTVVWLHSVGRDYALCCGICRVPAHRLHEAAPTARIVAPQSAVRLLSGSLGTVCGVKLPIRAWFDVAGTHATSPPDEAGIEAAVCRVCALVDEQVKAKIHRVDPEFSS